MKVLANIHFFPSPNWPVSYRLREGAKVGSFLQHATSEHQHPFLQVFTNAADVDAVLTRNSVEWCLSISMLSIDAKDEQHGRDYRFGPGYCKAHWEFNERATFVASIVLPVSYP